jgi:hypothetical protein
MKLMKRCLQGFFCSVLVAVCSGCGTIFAVADVAVSTAVNVTGAVVNTGIKATEAVVDAVIPSKK